MTPRDEVIRLCQNTSSAIHQISPLPMGLNTGKALISVTFEVGCLRYTGLTRSIEP